jgi:hypothetical protein
MQTNKKQTIRRRKSMKWSNSWNTEKEKYIKIAGEFLGTDPSLRTLDCIEIALEHADIIRRDLSNTYRELREKNKTISNLQKHTLEHLKLIGDLQIELEKSLLLNLKYEKVLYNKGKVTP